MHSKWKNRVNFVSIYIMEAHPVDEWHIYTDICYKQPKTLEERTHIALKYVDEFHYEIPLVVDDMSNECERLYAAWPERFYVIQQHKVGFKGQMGPDGYKPSEVESWLQEHVK